MFTISEMVPQWSYCVHYTHVYEQVAWMRHRCLCILEKVYWWSSRPIMTVTI